MKTTSLPTTGVVETRMGRLRFEGGYQADETIGKLHEDGFGQRLVCIFSSLCTDRTLLPSGLANGRPFPSLGSRDNPARNADGGTDLYLEPKAPEGKEKNWLATVPGRGYFAIMRLYGPTEPALTKTWKPGDVASVR